MYTNTKVVKKPKDLNAPKKNQSSYFIYSNERRPILMKETQQPVTEISKTISAEWKAMDPSQKKVYEDRAVEQKQKYLLELEVYQKTDNYSKYQVKFAEWKERATALGHIGKGSKKNKGKNKPPKKPKQPEAMPKRPQSSYFLFSNERRVSIKSQYPDKKLTDLSKLIAEEWKNISPEDKKGYEDKAGVCKEKYKIEIGEYKKTDEYNKYAETIEEWKAETKRFKSGKMDVEEPQIKVSLPRKPKDAKCPKRALTSYFLYAKEVREATKAEFPEKPITEIAKEISKKWKVLTADEKKPYEEESKRLKEQYKIDIAEYQDSEAQNEFKKQLEEWKIECDRRKQAAKAKQQRKQAAQTKRSPKKKARKLRKSPKKSPKKSAQRMDYSSSDSDSDSSSGSSSSGSYSGSSSSSGSESSSSSSSD